MQNVAFKFYVSGRQSCQWLTRCVENVGRCHCILILFLVYPVEPIGYVVHSKYCIKREHQYEHYVYVKTETKPLKQNTYFVNFLEGHLSALHSPHLKKIWIFRKPFKIIVSSTLKKHVSTLWRDGSLPISLHLMFLNEKVTLLFVIWFSVLCIKLCIYIMLFVSNSLSNLIICGYYIMQSFQR